MARKKSIAEMRRQISRIKGIGSDLYVRAYSQLENGYLSDRLKQINARVDRAQQGANRYATRIIGRTTYNPLSYSQFSRSDIDNKQYTSRFYMSRASG